MTRPPSAYSPHLTTGPIRAERRSRPTPWATTSPIWSPAARLRGLGWLLTRWTDITLFIPVGMLAGMALSLYTIWLRYGRT